MRQQLWLRLWSLFATTLLLGGLAGCGSGNTTATTNASSAATSSKDSGPTHAKVTSGTIKIVSSLPRTGSAKAQTDTMVNGIKLALEEANYKVGDFKLEYQDLDDATASAGEWTAERETANAKQAAADPDVMAYIGPYNSGAAKVSMPILNKAGLFMISPANTWPGLTKKHKADPTEPGIYQPSGKRNYARVVPADDLQGPLGAKWAKDMGVKKVYVLHDNQLYGQGVASLFAGYARRIGLEVLKEDGIDTKAQEFKSLMTAIGEKAPDLIYFGGTSQSKGPQLARGMVEAGLKAKLMVPDGCFEKAFIDAAGAQTLEGRCYVTFGGVPVAEQLKGPGKAFVLAYRAKYNTDPEAYAIYAYESAKVVLAAIGKAGDKNRAAITEAALAIRDFDGVLGRWSFDDNGDTTLTTMSGSVVRAGEFAFERVLTK